MAKVKNQKILFLEGLLMGIKSGNPQQNKPFTIGCKERHCNIPVTITVYPNAKNCLPFKLNDGLWQSWDEEYQIENTFKMFGLV
jgi:hypothetical protein